MRNPALVPPLLHPHLHTAKPPFSLRALPLRRSSYWPLRLAGASDNLAMQTNRIRMEQDY